VTTVGKPSLGGPFTLVDFNGRPVTDQDFRGEFLLLYFGFTHCPDICPSELVKVGKILDLMGTSTQHAGVGGRPLRLQRRVSLAEAPGYLVLYLR
jgi:cytochrome oxidase Cu insertion factor (SCO1/SenC/PrrC family)